MLDNTQRPFAAVYKALRNTFSDEMIERAIKEERHQKHILDKKGFVNIPQFILIVRENCMHYLAGVPRDPKYVMPAPIVSNDTLQARTAEFIAKVARTSDWNKKRLTALQARRIAFAKKQPQIGMSPPIGVLPETDWYERIER